MHLKVPSRPIWFVRPMHSKHHIRSNHCCTMRWRSSWAERKKISILGPHIGTNRPPLPHPIFQSFPDQKLAMRLHVRMQRTVASSSSVLISSQFCATLVSRKGERLFAACRVQESKERRMEGGEKSPPDCVYAHMRRRGGELPFLSPFSPYILTTGKKGCMRSWRGGGQRKTLSLAPTNRPSLLARPFSILFIPLAHPSGHGREGVGFFLFFGLFQVVSCGFRCYRPLLNIELIH